MEAKIKNNWSKIGNTKRAGLVVPLFSVYSKNSLGIGDFSDLKLVIDFCKKSGNSILQLLPMNEVGPVFCPYDSVSSFALDPVYLSLRPLIKNNKPISEKIKRLREDFSLNGRDYVDYRIKKIKLEILREIFELGGCILPKSFDKFREENAYWLDDFALFKVLKLRNAGRPWYEWEERFKSRDAKELKKFIKINNKEINFEFWLQWQIFKQFKEAKTFAADKNILLKGDLPIFVSRDSADVWAHRQLFKLDFAAGAPPDMYCAKGQRWGMPTYNWDNIEADNFKYLKEKLKFAERFYDILRVDHVVGLFRVWSIPYNEPLENQGLNGFFDPQDESLWEGHGRRILTTIISNTSMLVCAEDLGIIPQSCPKVLEELGIPGNDVQRWVKDWQFKHDFLEPENYRKLSVAMLSTHDTTNWPAWWENEAGTADEGLFRRKCLAHGFDYDSLRNKLFDPVFSRHGRLRWLNRINSLETLANIFGKNIEEIQDINDIYLNTYHEKEKLWLHLNIVGLMREKFDPEIIKAALFIVLMSESIFSIQLLNDWLFLAGVFKDDPYKYRTNTPGTISEVNWSLLVPIPLEDLLAGPICNSIKKMVRLSKRT